MYLFPYPRILFIRISLSNYIGLESGSTNRWGILDQDSSAKTMYAGPDPRIQDCRVYGLVTKKNNICVGCSPRASMTLAAMWLNCSHSSRFSCTNNNHMSVRKWLSRLPPSLDLSPRSAPTSGPELPATPAVSPR